MTTHTNALVPDQVLVAPNGIRRIGFLGGHHAYRTARLLGASQGRAGGLSAAPLASRAARSRMMARPPHKPQEVGMYAPLGQGDDPTGGSP
jgi:hypothetical protein